MSQTVTLSTFKRWSMLLPSGLLYLNVWWVTVVGDTWGMPPEVILVTLDLQQNIYFFSWWVWSLLGQSWPVRLFPFWLDLPLFCKKVQVNLSLYCSSSFRYINMYVAHWSICLLATVIFFGLWNCVDVSNRCNVGNLSQVPAHCQVPILLNTSNTQTNTNTITITALPIHRDSSQRYPSWNLLPFPTLLHC